jgi:hypothetical protein
MQVSTQVATATSALDGSVTFKPASITGRATDLVGLAVIRNASAVRNLQSNNIPDPCRSRNNVACNR